MVELHAKKVCWPCLSDLSELLEERRGPFYGYGVVLNSEPVA